jgi:hypothetical protein
VDAAGGLRRLGLLGHALQSRETTESSVLLERRRALSIFVDGQSFPDSWTRTCICVLAPLAC